jgi:hypothetical protein
MPLRLILRQGQTDTGLPSQVVPVTGHACVELSDTVVSPGVTVMCGECGSRCL